jgi:hypothetical protein
MFKVRIHDTRTLKWWFSHRDDIDLEPPYQRKGRLWSQHDRAYLIDSIINEYDIPKIYLADFIFVNTALNTKSKPYSVIDGRQRLESIFGFFRNQFPLNSDFSFIPDPTLALGGLFYADLQKNYPKISSIFEEFNLHVMSVMTDDEGKINDLFVRLNTSKPLTGAEIRNAMTGRVPSAIRQIAEHDFFKDRIRFSTQRGQDKNAAGKVLLIEFRGKFVDTKKIHLDRFVQEGRLSENDSVDRAASRVIELLTTMADIFHSRDPILSSQGSIPVYYWLLRTVGPHVKLREFLLRFEEERKENRAGASNDQAAGDQELLRYDVLNRSTNDQGSLQGRFDILLKRFKRMTEDPRISEEWTQ